jgi:hypothetical protein
MANGKGQGTGGKGQRDYRTTGQRDHRTTDHETGETETRRSGDLRITHHALRITNHASRITGLNFHGNEPEKFPDIAGSGAFNWQPRDNFGCGVHRPSQFDEVADARVLRALCSGGLSSDLG